MPKNHDRYTQPKPQLVYRNQFFNDDQSSSDVLAPHQGLLDDGSSAGATVYYHYTDKTGYDGIIASQQITDYYRKLTRPNAAEGVYLTDEMYSVEEAKLLFLGADGLYSGRADYVFMILLSCKFPLEKQVVSSNSTYYEFIYNGPIKFVKARSELRACDRNYDGDAVVLYHGPNTFSATSEA